jgi:hypothetical protein
MAFFRCPAFYLPIGNDVAAKGFRYLIVRSCEDTKRCMYVTRAHICCGGIVRELS